MGALLSGLYKKDTKVVMIGLDAAGKTVILNKLAHGETVMSIPTIGFNVETFTYKKLRMTAWDVGGQDKIRPLWRHYFQNMDAVIFVVDSADKARFGEAADELAHVLSSELLSEARLLVYANKADLEGAASPSELAVALGLHNLPSSRQWYIQPSVALTGEGLPDGLDWLSAHL